MLYCLRVMHSLRLVHKDVKPSNILFSPSVGDFVLLDFGVSTYVFEELGLMTFAFREGTRKYMSPEMRKLQAGDRGYLDLYWNDIYGLKVTLEELKKDLKQDSLEESDIEASYANCYEHTLLSLLYLRETGHQRPTTGDMQKRSSLQALLPYFDDILSDHALPGSIDEPSRLLNPEFLIRSIGLNSELLCHLSKFTNIDKKMSIVTKKLSTFKYGPKSIANFPPSIKSPNSKYFLFELNRQLKIIEEDPEKDHHENI